MPLPSSASNLPSASSPSWQLPRGKFHNEVKTIKSLDCVDNPQEILQLLYKHFLWSTSARLRAHRLWKVVNKKRIREGMEVIQKSPASANSDGYRCTFEVYVQGLCAIVSRGKWHEKLSMLYGAYCSDTAIGVGQVSRAQLARVLQIHVRYGPDEEQRQRQAAYQWLKKHMPRGVILSWEDATELLYQNVYVRENLHVDLAAWASDACATDEDMGANLGWSVR
jgi:hypothetical protein